MTDGEGVEAAARIAPFITKGTRDKKCQQNHWWRRLGGGREHKETEVKRPQTVN